MPIYPASPTFIGGFYNNHTVSGVKDRIYNAMQIREPYKSIFSNGVKPNDNGVLGTDLQVQLVSGMQIKVAAGRGMFGGAFFWNRTPYIITLDNPGSSNRYDCIIVRNDDSDSVRRPSIYIKTLNRVPIASDLVRTNEINEYCLAYIEVPALSVSIDPSNINDTRLDSSLCGVITGVYNQVDGAAITAQWNSAFYNWFNDVKDDFISHATLIHVYSSTTITTVLNQTRVAIGIPQYNKNLDTLVVMVEGRVFAEGTDYTIYSNGYVDFLIGFPVIGTKVYFQVYKSVDGSDAQTVVSQVNTLINQMNLVNNKLEFDYYCNGTTDNLLISNIIKEFISSGNDSSIKLNIIGTFGYSTMAAGVGSTADPYRFFDFTESVPRGKVILDFTNCSKIFVSPENGKTTVLFVTGGVRIIGLRIDADNILLNTVVAVFNANSPTINIVCEYCYFWIKCYGFGYIAYRGRFINCYGSVLNVGGNSFCFYSANNSYLVIEGGEFRAYTGSNSSTSGLLVQEHSGAIAMLYSVSVPTVSETGYYQTNSIYHTAGECASTYLVSALPVQTTVGNSKIWGTIAISRPNVV